MDGYLVHDEHGRPLSLDDIPSVRLLPGEAVEPLLSHTINPVSGDARWQLLKADALTDGGGHIVAAVTVIADLTAVKSAEVHMRILAESGRMLPPRWICARRWRTWPRSRSPSWPIGAWWI